MTGAFASGGTAEFDGHGHFTLTATSSFNGAVSGPPTYTGTYSVNSDCSYTSQATNGATFRAAIVNHGRELLLLQTNNGAAIVGTARKRGPAGEEDDDDWAPQACTLTGTYGFLADGSAGVSALPGAPFGPLVGVGIVTAHPNGTFMMIAQRSVNGTIDPEPLPLTGSYARTGECSFRLTFDVGFHFDASVVNRKETIFIETDPGTAVIVRAKRL